MSENNIKKLKEKVQTHNTDIIKEKIIKWIRKRTNTKASSIIMKLRKKARDTLSLSQNIPLYYFLQTDYVSFVSLLCNTIVCCVINFLYDSLQKKNTDNKYKDKRVLNILRTETT